MNKTEKTTALGAAIAALTTGERAVLRAALAASSENGHDFGFADQISVPGMNKHQIAGTLGSLAKRGLIDTDNPGDYTAEAFYMTAPEADLGWDAAQAITKALGNA